MQQHQDKEDPRETTTSTRLVLTIFSGILLVIVVLVTNYPAAFEWISIAAQAEFVPPDLAPSGPTQVAQPAEQMRIVRSN